MKKHIHIYLLATILLLTSCVFTYNFSGSYTQVIAAETISNNNSDNTDSGNSGQINPPSITLTKKNYSLYPGQTITPKIIKSDGYTGKITYSSKKNAIATFTDGVITAKKKGKTILTATAEDNTKIKITVHIKKPIKKINIHLQSIGINKGEKRTITVNIKRDGSKEPVIWKSSNKKIVSVNKDGKITAKRNGTAYICCKSKYSKKSDRIKVVVKKTKYSAMTCDDGPGVYTDKLLNALKKYDSKATFFVIGNNINSYSSTLKKEYEYGHQIGNHTYNHPILTRLSKSDIRNEFKSTKKLVKKYTGKNPTITRPPYGSYNDMVLKLTGTPIALWSVDTLDWKYRNADYVRNTILSNADDGEIVLLHDIHATSVEGFIKALPILKKWGYELVTINELFELKEHKLENGKVYFYCK